VDEDSFLLFYLSENIVDDFEDLVGERSRVPSRDWKIFVLQTHLLIFSLQDLRRDPTLFHRLPVSQIDDRSDLSLRQGLEVETDLWDRSDE